MINSDVPAFVLLGGPGCGKDVQAQKLADKHPGWVHVNLGEILRAKSEVKDLVCQGELVPEVSLWDRSKFMYN